MKFPDDELLGYAKDENRKRYTLDFYGQNEGAAVVSGPCPEPEEGLREVPEVHRESADSAADAKQKLTTWLDEKGWSYVWQKA